MLSKSNNSNSSGANNQKDKSSHGPKRSVKRGFSRFRTIGNTGKISQDSSEDENLNEEKFMLEEENLSEDENDNPVVKMINLYQ